MEEADKKNEGDGQPPTQAQVAGDVQSAVESPATSNAVKVSPYADSGM